MASSGRSCDRYVTPGLAGRQHLDGHRSAAGPDLDAGGGEFVAAAFVVGHATGDFGPVAVGVVELFEVGEFVDDDVVDKAGR